MAFVHGFDVDFGYPIEAVFPTINCNTQFTTRRYGIQFVVIADLHYYLNLQRGAYIFGNKVTFPA